MKKTTKVISHMPSILIADMWNKGEIDIQAINEKEMVFVHIAEDKHKGTRYVARIKDMAAHGLYEAIGNKWALNFLNGIWYE